MKQVTCTTCNGFKTIPNPFEKGDQDCFMCNGKGTIDFVLFIS